MTDLAELGIRVRSEEVATTDERLDALTASAARAEGAVDRLGDTSVTTGSQVSILNAAVRQQDAVLMASRASMGLTAAEGLNLSRQFADIGVTAAMGMNPLMIALQQGPQIFDAFQVAATRAGTSVRSVMAQTGAAVWAALAPLLPAIAAVGAVAAIGFGGFGLATREARSELGDLTDGMGLTEDQLDKLKEKGVETGVTVGDVFNGLGTTIKEVFFDMFGPQLDQLGRLWDETMDRLWQATSAAVKALAGGFVGAFYVVRDTWRFLPAVMGDVAYSAANAVLAGVDALVNGGILRLNSLIVRLAALSSRPEFRVFSELRLIDGVDIAGVANPYAGAAQAAGARVGERWSAGFAQGVSGIEDLYAQFLGNIEAAHERRIRAAAGDADDSPEGRARREREARISLRPLPRLDLDPLRTRVPEITTNLELLADELRLIKQLADETARGMASAFGETGRAIGDLMTVMTSYESRLAEIALAEQEGRLFAAQADRERAQAQIQNYGDMAMAARGFFKEGSDGYNAMLAIEQVYRAFQFASMIQSMALGGQETAMSIANSISKGAASAAAGAAKMFEFLGPLAFPAVAAMLGLLAGLGLGSGGGSSAKLAAANDNDPGATTDAIRAASAREQQGRDAAAASVAQAVKVQIEMDTDLFTARVRGEAVQATAPVIAAAAAGTKRDVFDTLKGQQAGNRRAVV